MKVQVTFKTPDAVRDAVVDQFMREVRKNPARWLNNRDMDIPIEDWDRFFAGEMGPREFEDLFQNEIEQEMKSVSKFVRYGECVKIEFDTVARTAVVLEV